MSKKEGDVFSVEKIRELLELMKEFDLTEIDLGQDQQKIRLSRVGQAVVVSQPVMAAAASPAAAATPMPAATAVTAVGSAPAGDGPHIKLITSPMVGTFYSKPKPDSDDFVKVGSVVGKDTVVCIVEAMKVFNDIPAEVAGKIVEILAKNEDAVDFGRPLFKVDTRG